MWTFFPDSMQGRGLRLPLVAVNALCGFISVRSRGDTSHAGRKTAMCDGRRLRTWLVALTAAVSATLTVGGCNPTLIGDTCEDDMDCTPSERCVSHTCMPGGQLSGITDSGPSADSQLADRRSEDAAEDGGDVGGQLTDSDLEDADSSTDTASLDFGPVDGVGDTDDGNIGDAIDEDDGVRDSDMVVVEDPEEDDGPSGDVGDAEDAEMIEPGGLISDFEGTLDRVLSFGQYNGALTRITETEAHQGLRSVAISGQAGVVVDSSAWVEWTLLSSVSVTHVSMWLKEGTETDATITVTVDSLLIGTPNPAADGVDTWQY